MSPIRCARFAAVVLALATPSPAHAEPGETLTLEAERLEVDLPAGCASAEGAVLTACGDCGAPFTVTARRASIDRGGDLDLLLPVLRIGPVPVLAAPWVRIRTGRQPGLLLPRLGYRSGAGFEVGEGVYLPVADRVEALVSGAWLSGIEGAEVRGALRGDRVELDARLLAGRETMVARLRGRGSARAGRLAASAALDMTLDPEGARRLAEDAFEEARSLERSRLAMVRDSSVFLVGLRGDLLRGLLEGDPASSPLPLLGLSLALHPLRLGPVLASAAADEEMLLRRDGPWPGSRALLRPRLALPLRLGPVASRLAVSSLHAAWTSPLDEGAATTSRHAVVAGLDLAAPLGRELAPGLLHTIEPALSIRLAVADEWTGEIPTAAASDAAAWPLAGNLVALSIRTALAARGDRRLALSATEVLDLPRLAGEAATPRLDLALDVRDRGFAASLAASLAEAPRLALAEARASATLPIGPFAALDVGWRWIGADGGETLGPDPRAPLPFDALFAAEPAHSLLAGLTLRPHPEVTLDAGARVDLAAATAVVAGGGIGYRNRCGCLGASLGVWQRHGRPWPDVILSADLGGLVSGR